MPTNTTPAQPKKLLDQVRDKIRFKHYSLSTEDTYISWIKQFILFHGKRHPADMGVIEVERFLTYLATERHVSSSTQNQALSAILFLYREVLTVDLPWLDGFQRSKKPRRLPVVLTVAEVQSLLRQAEAAPEPIGLIIRLLYGTGMRLMEAVRLRIKDVELSRREIVVRDGKGGKDRVTMLPESLLEPMRAQLALRRAWHDQDILLGKVDVWLPDALAIKYPNASKEGVGNTFLRPKTTPRIRAAKSSAVIMSKKNRCSAMLKKPLRQQALPSRLHRIPCAIHLRRTYCRPVTIFARYKSCLVIVM
jgi:integron integrase